MNSFTQVVCVGLLATFGAAVLLLAPVPKAAPRNFAKTAALTVPRFEEAPCAIEVPAAEKEKVRCGYLVVPENRSRKGSRAIRLPIIIQKSNSPNPAPDPVLRTLGGPGGSSLRMVTARRGSPWLNRRDLIIFEQRGTRFAQPRLDCPEVNAANAESALKNLDDIAASRNEVAAAKICHDRLVKEGVDLGGYNSRESAADIADLRKVLGYKEWNLYGVSYSARLMLDVMRYYPEGIRSVAIESVLAPQVDYDEVGMDAAVRALKAMFANCATEADCAKAHPNLEKVFYEVVARANREPVSFEVKPAGSDQPVTVKLNGTDLAAWIIDYLLSNDSVSAADAPLQIYRFSRGDFRALQNYAAEKLSGSSSYSLGMRYSFWCSEEMPFENRAQITAQRSKYPGLSGRGITGWLPDICAVWQVPRVAAIANQPVRSTIPTLLLGAEYDAYTPPAWAQRAGKTLPNSYYFEVPGVGHGPGFSSACARQMVAAFFDDPSKAPDARCLQNSRPKFATEPAK
jgi:pimeloyl-ACP methyl ester carboxylesterase